MLDEVGSQAPLPAITARQADSAGGHVLHDEAMLPEPPDDEFFDPEHWRRQDAIVAEPEGRAAVCIFCHQGRALVLRHYHRGGWIARVSRDRYVWTGLGKTRPWQEWHMLADLHDRGLPVPRPVAARVRRHGPFYSADLVTVWLPGTRTLADRLADASLPETTWRTIGAVIKRFHVEGVYHADLNARNILINDAGDIFLIDFDKGQQGNTGPEAQLANLERLQRSLNKFKDNDKQGFHFEAECWRRLLEGYREADDPA